MKRCFTLSTIFAFCFQTTLLASPEADTGEGVRFVAYNLKNYLLMERRVEGETVPDAPKPEEETKVLLAHLAEIKPDILGVCELGDQAQLSDLQKRLKKAGVDLPHSSLCVSVDGIRNLGLLSRFPITSENHQTGLDYQIGADVIPFRRGILDATVTISEDYELRLIGLHLKSKRPVPEADEALMRRNEAALTRAHIDTILEAAPETNLLVYGDLNDTPNESPIKALQGTYNSPEYLQGVPLKDEDGLTWTYFWSYADVYSRFDYIFANRAVLPEIDEEKCFIYSGKDWFTASDHRPLILTLNPKNQE
jgi:endonuclease/exonuclease/phosphatase family metal-dependent hydrolase